MPTVWSMGTLPSYLVLPNTGLLSFSSERVMFTLAVVLWVEGGSSLASICFTKRFITANVKKKTNKIKNNNIFPAIYCFVTTNPTFHTFSSKYLHETSNFLTFSTFSATLAYCMLPEKWSLGWSLCPARWTSSPRWIRLDWWRKELYLERASAFPQNLPEDQKNPLYLFIYLLTFFFNEFTHSVLGKFWMFYTTSTYFLESLY